MLTSLQKVVIPLKKGIHAFINYLKRIDSRLRGNDTQVLSRLFAVASMLVVLVSYRSLFVVSVVVIVIMRMTVGQIPMAVLVIMIDHRGRGLASQASASLAHMNLHEPLRTGVS
jgi:hypothetical protein